MMLFPQPSGADAASLDVAHPSNFCPTKQNYTRGPCGVVAEEQACFLVWNATIM